METMRTRCVAGVPAVPQRTVRLSPSLTATTRQNRVARVVDKGCGVQETGR